MAEGMNWQVAQALNQWASHTALITGVMRLAATDLVVLLFLLLPLWWVLPLGTERGKVAALTAAGALLVGQGINLVIGQIFRVPRPFVAHPGAVVLLVTAARDSSFPSDHATAAFSIAATAVLRDLPGRWLILGTALLVAVARVAVGVHYPLDVLAGAGLGILWAGIARWLDRYVQRVYRALMQWARQRRVG